MWGHLMLCYFDWLTHTKHQILNNSVFYTIYF